MIPEAEIHANSNATIVFSSLGLVGQHYYYRNSGIKEIYYLNIPKNASQFLRNSMHFFFNNSDNPKSFCIVREPVDRFLSIYKYAINVEENFDRFAESFFHKKNLSTERYIKVGVEHFMPQLFFVDNAPKKWKDSCQLITMEEFFSNGVNAGLEKIGLTANITIPNSKLNFSDYDDSYKKWLIDRLYTDYQKEFEQYLHQDAELYERAKNKEILNS